MGCLRGVESAFRIDTGTFSGLKFCLGMGFQREVHLSIILHARACLGRQSLPSSSSVDHFPVIAVFLGFVSRLVYPAPREGASFGGRPFLPSMAAFDGKFCGRRTVVKEYACSSIDIGIPTRARISFRARIPFLYRSSGTLPTRWIYVRHWA